MLKKRENILKVRRNMMCAYHYGTAVTWNEIESFLDETFYSALERWYYTTLWGMANGSVGWANEPTDYIDAISILESEKNVIENEETQKRIDESAKKSGSGKRKGK